MGLVWGGFPLSRAPSLDCVALNWVTVPPSMPGTMPCSLLRLPDSSLGLCCWAGAGMGHQEGSLLKVLAPSQCCKGSRGPGKLAERGAAGPQARAS